MGLFWIQILGGLAAIIVASLMLALVPDQLPRRNRG